MKSPLLLFLSFLLFQINVHAQGGDITVNGTVVDAETGIPVPAVNVIQQGTSNGVLTNFDGEFTIEVPSDAVLEFSYIGFATKEVPVNGQTELNVTLSAEAAALEEVIVVGYGTQRKVDLTGSVSVVDVESMSRQPTAQVAEQLQGQASGVTVTTSGQPGASPQVRIRGINTFGSSTPLYVVDGVPTGDIGHLNPNDIANMQVLKDAGSASIYGARASNGVIIITTKKGTGDLTINYNGYYGSQRVPQGNVFDILSPQEHADLRWMAQQNTNPGEPITDSQYGSGATPTLPYYILPAGASQGEVDESTYNLDPFYTDGGVVGSFNQIMRANQQGTNWFQEIFDNAPIMNHDISIGQGSERGNFLFSMSYIDQQGTLINSYYDRYTARVNSQFNVNDNFRIGQNLAVALSENNGVDIMDGENPINHAYRMQPIIPVYDIAGNFAGTEAPGLGNAKNPVAMLERNRNNYSNTSRIFGNIFAELDFLDVFTLRSNFGGNYSNTNGRAFAYPEYENVEDLTTNQLTETAGTGYNWTWSNTLQYQQNFNDLHDVSVLLGTEAYHNQYKEITGIAQGFYSFDPDFVNLSTGSGTQTTAGWYSEDALFSLFGRLDYTFDDKYLIGATLRRDATRFADPNYGWFPSVSAGWRISQENFMQDVDWISELKLRGGYGVMGNQQNVDPANRFTTYGSDRISSFYDINGSNSSIVEGFQRLRIGNPNAKWEKNINANIGIDASLFQSRLQLTADYYRKDVVDLLYNPELSATAGLSTVPYVNIAEMTNSGFDLSATTFADFTSDLKLTSTLTFTTYSNEIVNIAEGVSYFDQEGRRFNGSAIVRNAVGHSVGQFHGYKIEGFWDSQSEVDQANSAAQAASGNPDAEYQSNIGVGRFRYADTDGNGIVNADDRTFLGNPNPDFTAGLNIELTYKNFDFNMFLYGVYGNDIWNQVKWWNDFYSSFGGAKSSTALYDSWTPTNQNATAPIQEVGGTNATANVPNSYFVEDGSYLRARNVQLGYSLPTEVLDQINVSRLRVYVQASNLFTITNYSGVDPELTGTATAFGIDEASYPTPRQYLVGVNLSL